jgi:hypothetical protein
MSTRTAARNLKAVPIGVVQPERDAPYPATPAPECERLWSVDDVSRFLGVPISTLHQWRYLGRGPGAFRVGKHLRYDPEVVRRWLVDDCAGEPA